ncbi:MAG: SLC13 family permease [Dehalococcoidia bacterium]
MQEVALAVVLAATIAALYVRPFGAKDWQIAVTGAAVAWLAGPLGLQGGVDAIVDSANIVAFFLGLMLISAGAESAGLYRNAAQLLEGFRPRRPRLIAVASASIGVTAVLSNDATPLVLTPAVLTEGAGRNGFSRHAALTVTFLADGASLLLPFSNPVNLLFFDRFNLSMEGYLADITPAAIAGAAVIAAILCVRAPSELPLPAPVGPRVPSRQTGFAMALVVLLASAYVVAGYAGFPLGAVTVAGGVAMCAVARGGGEIHLRQIRRHVSFGLLAFVAALLLLLQSVTNAETFEPLESALERLESQPALVAVLCAAALAAVLANLMNNWPAALLMVAVIAGVPGDHHALIAGAMIGLTIGANFTLFGSLSTIFWLNLAANGKASFSATEYARRAFVPTLAGAGAACLVVSLLV